MNKEQLKGFRDGIEKDASLLVATGLTGGAGAGVSALRTKNLTEEDARILKHEYNLKNDADLSLRSQGRGFLGGVGGAILGAGIGGGLTGGNSPGAAVTGALLGTLGGAYNATNKYSKGRAEEVKKRMIMNAALRGTLNNG